MQTYYYIGVTGVTCFFERQGNRFWLDRDDRGFRVIHRVSKRSEAFDMVDDLNSERDLFFKRSVTQQHDEQFEFQASLPDMEAAVQRSYEERLKLLPKLVDDCDPHNLEDPGNSWDVELARRARKCQMKRGEKPWDIDLEYVDVEENMTAFNTIPKPVLLAHITYEWACKQRPDLVQDNGDPDKGELYAYIKENGHPDYLEYSPPSLGSWQRYLSKYRMLTQGPANSPRASRDRGSSIVHKDQIEHR